MICNDCGLTISQGTAICPQCGAKMAIPILEKRAEIRQVSSHSIFNPTGKAIAGEGESFQEEKKAKGNLLQPGYVLANRYRIDRYLGMGSLCNCYLVFDLESGNREVVLKVLNSRKANEPDLVDGFLFLAGSVAKYNHPGIARIFDAGAHAGSAYYTMEFLEGQTLRMWLLENLTFDKRVLPGLEIIRSLLEIICGVHEKGCYGCLKPENIFITAHGPMIMDFGAVGFLTAQEFEFNAGARRYLAYMAPELKQDWSNLVPQSDDYSIAAILYEVLTGKSPAGSQRLPSSMSPIYGVETDELVLKALAAQPGKRFSSSQAFLDGLKSLHHILLEARGRLPAAETNSKREKRPAAQSVLSPASVDVYNTDTADDEGGRTDAPLPRVGEGLFEPGLLRRPSDETSPIRALDYLNSRDQSKSPRGMLDVEATRNESEAGGSGVTGPSRFEAGRLGKSAMSSRGEDLRAEMGESDEGVSRQWWDGEDGQDQDGRNFDLEEDVPPPPLWVWAAIIIGGILMSGLAAFFGLVWQ